MAKSLINEKPADTPEGIVDLAERIIRRHRLIRGTYRVAQQELAEFLEASERHQEAKSEVPVEPGAICGGGGYCYIGALWAASGVPLVTPAGAPSWALELDRVH